MANTKKIIVDYSESGVDIYAIIRRETDGYLLDDTDGDFAETPATSSIELTESTNIPGRYELEENREEWDDGEYTAAIYLQTGASPDPASDIIVASWSTSILDDAQGSMVTHDITTQITALPAAIWNYLTSALTTVGSIGKALAAWLASIPAGSTAFGSTDLAICNDALLLLGNNAIDDLTDDTKAAKLCTQYYQRTVDSVIRAYTWNCATVRSDELTATTDPTFGFSNAYTLPADCLRVLKMYDDDTYKYRVENGALLCDEGTAQITYLKRIGAEDMDPLLAEAVAARLAATIAFSLTNSVSAAEAMWKLYKDKLDEAQTTDAFEGTAPQMASSDWVNARR